MVEVEDMIYEQEEWWNNDEEFGGDGDDEPDNALPNPIREVGDEARVLFANFRGAVEEERPHHDEVEPNGRAQEEEELAVYVIIADRLRVIGDEIDAAYRFRLEEESEQARTERLRNVAHAIFGGYPCLCWQQIGLMLYAGVRLVSKMLQKVTWGQFLIDLAVERVRHLIAQWILSLGGWPAVGEYFKTTTGQAWLVFIAGVASAILVYGKYD